MGLYKCFLSQLTEINIMCWGIPLIYKIKKKPINSDNPPLKRNRPVLVLIKIIDYVMSPT